MHNSWQGIEAQFQQLVSRPGHTFETNTINSARDFLHIAASRYPVADEVGEGYYPSICLDWLLPTLGLEIREGRFEVYRFFDRRTEIREFGPCEELVPPDLLAYLDTVLTAEPV